MSKRELSPEKIAANKANGLLSTGPRTPEGKARVSENALKHGLRSARNPLDISTQIPGEQTQFEELLADFAASHHPANPAETQLVARLAQLTLRLNRAAAMESAALGQARTEALDSANKFPSQFPDPDSPDFESAILASSFTRAASQLKLLSQYESRLSLDFARTLRQLQQLQKTRKQTQPALIPKDELPTTNATRSLASDGQIAVESERTQNPPSPTEPQSPDAILTKRTQISPPASPLISSQTNPTPHPTL